VLSRLATKDGRKAREDPERLGSLWRGFSQTWGLLKLPSAVASGGPAGASFLHPPHKLPMRLARMRQCVGPEEVPN